jgi:hypothetical protein
VSELRSALEAWEAEDPSRLSDSAVEECFAELLAAAERLAALNLRWLAEIDRRRPFEREGFLSTSSWLVGRFRMAGGQAGSELRLARALQEMPLAREALSSGQISLAAARMLASARESDREAYAEGEEMLVDAARQQSPAGLAKVVGYWRSAAQDRRDGVVAEEALSEQRRLHVSPTVFGMVRIDGDLDPETGETVLTALEAVLGDEARSRDPQDHRTPAQRRADALGVIARGWLDSAERPMVGGERPHVVVTVDLDRLERRGGSRCQAQRTGPVDVESARRLACDGSVSRLVLTTDSRPLDIGRKTNVVPSWIRRALVVRDSGCRFPGCGRPPSWTDAHHVHHWADGGITAVSNLVLLCRRHHRLIHWKRFGVEMVDGRPVFRSADGSVLEERGPP